MAALVALPAHFYFLALVTVGELDLFVLCQRFQRSWLCENWLPRIGWPATVRRTGMFLFFCATALAVKTVVFGVAVMFVRLKPLLDSLHARKRITKTMTVPCTAMGVQGYHATVRTETNLHAGVASFFLSSTKEEFVRTSRFFRVFLDERGFLFFIRTSSTSAHDRC